MSTSRVPDSREAKHTGVATDFAAGAIARMRGPAQMGIICVDITNKCDLKCSNCTRLLANQDHFWDMSLDNLRQALRSLHDFPGTIAILGGNPCMHRDFAGVCQVITEEVPDKNRRGLWTNNAFGFAELAAETFGVFNLNPHGEERGIRSLESIKHLGWYYEGNSEHSSLLAAVRDFYGEEEMWERIAACDINQNWSASIVENNGKLRAYFCEVAASFDLARGTDHGIEVTEGWWRRGIEEFSDQIRHFCPGCGVPARIKGHLDKDQVDTFSAVNADLAVKSQQNKQRKVVEVKPDSPVARTDHKVTTYSTNLVSQRRIAVITPYYKEPIEILRQAHESVVSQQVDAHVRHIILADGHPRAEIDTWDADHIVLPRAHGDNGNTPRGIGAMLADTEGYDFIAFLDADNWFHAGHLASLLELQTRTGASLCTAFRTLHAPDGTMLSRIDESGTTFIAFEIGEAELRHFDTSCVLLHRAAFALNAVWGRMPRQTTAIADRIFFTAAAHARIPFVSTQQRTVAFRSTYATHFLPEFGIEPPQIASENSAGISGAKEWLLTRQGVAECLDRIGFWPIQFLSENW